MYLMFDCKHIQLQILIFNMETFDLYALLWKQNENFHLDLI